MNEYVVRVSLHERKLSRSCVGHLLFGDGYWPQPSRIKVGVSNRINGVFEFTIQTRHGIFDCLSALTD